LGVDFLDLAPVWTALLAVKHYGGLAHLLKSKIKKPPKVPQASGLSSKTSAKVSVTIVILATIDKRIWQSSLL
jgi:hypothetical protein